MRQSLRLCALYVRECETSVYSMGLGWKTPAAGSEPGYAEKTLRLSQKLTLNDSSRRRGLVVPEQE